MNKTPEQKRIHEALIQQSIAAGKLIEVGWISMRYAVVSPNAPDVQVREMRMAYMAGAQHLFASILACFDPGAEPTDADMTRMAKIDAELKAYAKELELRVAPTGGAQH